MKTKNVNWKCCITGLAILATGCFEDPVTEAIRHAEQAAFTYKSCELQYLANFPSREELRAQYTERYRQEEEARKLQEPETRHSLSLGTSSLTDAQAGAAAGRAYFELVMEARSACQQLALEMQDALLDCLRAGATEAQTNLAMADGWKRAEQLHGNAQ
jgi:hypothetical protein